MEVKLLIIPGVVALDRLTLILGTGVLVAVRT